MPKLTKRLPGARVTKRSPGPKAMKSLRGGKAIKPSLRANATKRQPKEPKRRPEDMNRLLLADDSYLVMYVARKGITEERMYDHYENVMIPWLRDNDVTEVKCWISQHNRTYSIILQVDAYSGDWREIDDIHTLYRSNSKMVLMKAQLMWDGDTYNG
jgi:hypothetical protein